MKKNVLDIDDLREVSSFFNTKIGTFLGNQGLKWLQIDKVNQAHINSFDLRGSAFTHGLLTDPLIDVRYTIHNKEILDKLPEGAFVTVSNHPIGSLDGIILIDIFASRRPDYKVMVNGILTKISSMSDNFISVKPDSAKQGANVKNVNGVRLSLQRMKEGHPMGFFPAGGISMYQKETKDVRDISWAHSVIRLIRKAGVPVYPVYFDCKNSDFFYRLGRIDWRIRQLRIPAEAFNKRGRTVDVYSCHPVSPSEMAVCNDDNEVSDVLCKHTHLAQK